MSKEIHLIVSGECLRTDKIGKGSCVGLGWQEEEGGSAEKSLWTKGLRAERRRLEEAVGLEKEAQGTKGKGGGGWGSGPDQCRPQLAV